MFPFKMALNASTLFPFKLPVKQQMQVAAEAGYEGVELWMRDIEHYLAEGGNLQDLKRYGDELGISIVNCISFFTWAAKDATVREQGMVQAEKEMRLLAELGCPGIAAPPFGNVEQVTLADMAAAFAHLVEIGRRIGVEPYLEFWGRAKQLSTLSDALSVALQSGLPDVKILLDPYHMYTGGSSVNNLAYLKGSHIGIVHVNDYPANPERATIQDKDRVFPGDGIAPTAEIASFLHQAGYQGYLSLELFIADFGGQTALDVAKSGLAKSKQAFSISDSREAR
ncbi:sugar phosphate isomerase/epimerase family protein [Dictyobacter aurantiacus]|uniref:Xylose isomerase n=1 Tax=Dictyobacter aurantiacus TaxID=1936993 RepID=A0A401ZN74_9CHLR|nr:sugar phosphate isomerase/epimerase family protein [Dictyobacter aurantiacus]GCE08260.1 xylose isomerase [Dictyobacter aurantiacus]